MHGSGDSQTKGELGLDRWTIELVVGPPPANLDQSHNDAEAVLIMS